MTSQLRAGRGNRTLSNERASMTLTFVETTGFTAVIDKCFGSDEHYLRLQAALLRDPEAGVVIPGTGGLRKMRWPDPRRGKGKRGGLRVIYLHVAEGQVVVFLDVYDKNQTEYLSPAIKRAISAEAGRLREYYRQTR